MAVTDPATKVRYRAARAAKNYIDDIVGPGDNNVDLQAVQRGEQKEKNERSATFVFVVLHWDG